MSLENDFGYQRETKQQTGYIIEPFHIVDRATDNQWKFTIWPEIQKLFDTTWPGSSGAKNFEFFSATLRRKDSAVLLMKKLDGRLLGVSFMYPVSLHEQNDIMLSYPKDGKTAYNSSVIIDPQYRGEGLSVPLLEQTMSEASHLGYEYMIGRYNNSFGQKRPDGRRVQRGFANSIKGHVWSYGQIIPPTISVLLPTSNGYMQPFEDIMFQLVRPQIQITSVVRKNPFPAFASA